MPRNLKYYCPEQIETVWYEANCCDVHGVGDMWGIKWNPDTETSDSFFLFFFLFFFFCFFGVRKRFVLKGSGCTIDHQNCMAVESAAWGSLNEMLSASVNIYSVVSQNRHIPSTPHCR